MATKADSVVFDDADAIKQFTLGQNARVVAWITANWERCEGLTAPIHKSTVSKALSSMPTVAPVANALDIMLDEIWADPWAWCKPPESIDDLSEYAPLTWWFKTLKPPMAWNRFERMKAHPLDGDDRDLTQQRLDEWRDRLRAACDQFKTDSALVRALESDEDPEYQWWVDDGETRIADDREKLGYGKTKPFRRRVGNAGLHGASAEEIGLAYALADAELTLPTVEEARLAYTRPRVVPQHDHFSEEVEPWNGDEFEGVEIDKVERREPGYGETVTYQVKHRVCFYWNGDRYAVEDVEPFAWIRIPKHHKDEPDWRVPTSQERDLLETGVKREHESREELLARKDEWIAEVWGSQKDSWTKNENGQRFNKTDFPDGVPIECAVDAFDAMLGRVDDEAVRDEQRDVARGRMAFRRRLRRRAY